MYCISKKAYYICSIISKGVPARAEIIPNEPGQVMLPRELHESAVCVLLMLPNGSFRIFYLITNRKNNRPFYS